MTAEKQGLELNEAKRKLVTIQTIDDIQPIPNADQIEVATVRGWKIVIKKDEFKVGDKAIYFEIDSFLPDEPRFDFLGSTHRNPITVGTDHEEHGHRLSTVKLRKQISQGLLMPLSEYDLNPDIEVGTDMTETLGVTKYEKPEVATGMGTSSASFPIQYTEKTDEIRVQAMPKDYTQVLNKPYYMTYKYDGTSITIIKTTNDEGQPEIIVASRNITLDDRSMIHEFLKTHGIWDKLLEKPLPDGVDSLVFQGELYGPGIQSNRLGVTELRYAVFNVNFDHERVNFDTLLNVAHEYGFETPNIVEIGSDNPEQLAEYKAAIKSSNTQNTLKAPYGQAKLTVDNYVDRNFNYAIDELLEKASTLKYENGTVAEGMVIRPLDPETGEKPSFKAISNKYLLKYKL